MRQCSFANPWGPAESVRATCACVGAIHELPLHTYPDPDSTVLRTALAERYRLKKENVLVSRGATELIQLVLRVVKPKEVLVIEPACPSYREALEREGIRFQTFLLNRDHFVPSVEEIVQAAFEKVEFIFLANPNWPTGSLFEKKKLIECLRQVERRGIFVVIDESFIDWCPGESVVEALHEGARFLILRSFSSFYSLAGLRIGYGLGPRRLIERLEDYQVNWSVNALAQELALSALKDSEFAERSRVQMAEERNFLSGQLAKLKFLRFWPTRANFFLIQYMGPDILEWAQAVNQVEANGPSPLRGSPCGDLPGLTSAYFCLSVRTHEENVRALEFLNHSVTVR